MALCVSANIIWSYISYIPLIYIAGRNVTGGYQVAQPLGCAFINLVVVRSHLQIASATNGVLR
ncbi:hypothetical protein CPter91_3660 [Collimonas pratensis]|uniref:Uncharacterized protein n=1 Tax=Collimonas pratensis TaxID=279113 RepID=A0A127Q8P6_9BURK|nr:hypothetical protein CPter91_3660 [Collimonas pratensis]